MCGRSPVPSSILPWKQRPGKIIPCTEAHIFACFLLAQEVFVKETQAEGVKKGGLGMAVMRHLMSEFKKSLEMLSSAWCDSWGCPGVGLDDFDGCLQTQNMLWLYNSMFHKMIPTMELVHMQRSHSAYKETSGSICLRTTHRILIHHSQPFSPSNGRNLGLLWNISYFRRLLKHPPTRWNVFLCRETGEVTTHFHRAD